MGNLPYNIRVMNKQVIKAFQRLNKWAQYMGSNVSLDVLTLTSFFKSKTYKKSLKTTTQETGWPAKRRSKYEIVQKP